MIAKFLKKTEMLGLYCLALSLPTMQGPQNISIGLIIIGSLGWRFAEKPIQYRKPDTVEWILLLMWIMTLISSLFNVSDMLLSARYFTRGTRDVGAYALLFWVMYRNTNKPVQIRNLVWCIIFGTLIGLSHGTYNWYMGNNDFIEFNNINSVIVTLMYTNFIIILLLGIIIDPQSQFSYKSKCFFGLCILFFIFCLFLMGRRSCEIGFAVSFIFLLILFPRNKKLIGSLVIFTVLLTIFILSLTYVDDSKSINVRHIKNIVNIFKGHMGDSDKERVDAWKTGIGLIIRGDHFFLGVGPNQFKKIQVKDLNLNGPLKINSKTRFLHPHNLFLNKFCEEGFLGLLTLIFFFSYIAKKLFLFRKQFKQEDWKWIGALGTFINIMVVGMIDIPFQGGGIWMAMILLGLGMARIKESSNLGLTQK